MLPSDPPRAVTDAAEPLRDVGELEEIFHTAEKPADAWRVGGEAEKFGVDAASGAPIGYDGERGVTRIFASLVHSHGWNPVRETPDGPLIALSRGEASVTLEPGAQLELSGAPLASVHLICAELRGHLAELREISSEMNLVWLGVGFHPLATQAELSWVPKHRYAIMREYLPTRGSGALDMMRRTATVQANYDYSSEEDAMRKLRVGLALSPLAHAMTANSPFCEGRLAGKKSVRGDVWLRMDPARSGLIPSLWKRPRARYRDYVEWALDAGMFLFKRGDQYIANTGQTFRDFMKNGYAGHRATQGDWRLHLQTLFPEVRLKSTLEVRACDSLPTDLACSVPALFAGVFYDERALAAAEEFVADWDYLAVERDRPGLVTRGLEADFLGRPAREWAEQLIELAESGLTRRGRLSGKGNPESIHLERLSHLVEAGRCPADVLVEGLSHDMPELRREIIARCHI
ncbi:MAG: glutamate-cysteine ligase family protein [Sorangiineae bacterium]|nr:glutamate-cysteine ligase family protein [Polyangiaceae bacterium]MEB2324084.1 glutamate-cysteine ligase family protein [Sorangiineae bacterium]